MPIVVIVIHDETILQYSHNASHGIINLSVTHTKLIVKLKYNV